MIPERANPAADGARPLGFLDAFCLGLNAIVGASIFLFPGILAGMLGPASPLAFVVTGLILLPVALCFAEAASRFDRPGGPYLYMGNAFGGAAGYGVGWLCWVTELISWAAVASGLAAYLEFFGGPWAHPAAGKALAVLVVAVMGGLNYRGVRLAAWAVNFFTLAKLVPLSAFVVLGLAHGQWGNFASFAVPGLGALGKACFLAFFAFSGFEVVPVPAGEVRSPGTTVPRALVGSLLAAAVLYALIQTAAVGAHAGLAGSKRPLADAAALFMGPLGASLMVAGAAISNIGFNAGCALGGPRYLVALAADRHLPEWLAGVHPRFGTPHRAIAATAGLTLAAILLLDFRSLVDFAVVVICAQYLGTCAAVPFLKGEALPFWRRWLIPSAGAAASLWIGSQAGRRELLWAAAFLAAGLLLRLVCSAGRGFPGRRS